MSNFFNIMRKILLKKSVEGASDHDKTNKTPYTSRLPRLTCTYFPSGINWISVPLIQHLASGL